MFTWTATIGSGLYLLLCTLGLLRGRWPERVVAATLMLEFIGVLFLEDVRHLESLQTGVFMADLLVLIVLLWVVYRSQRRWVLVAAACQLMAVLTHVAKLADPSLGGWGYMTGGIVFGYGPALSLAVGALLTRPGKAADERD